MPTLTLPTTFTDGNVLAPADVNDNFYKPTASDASFEIINGHLDSDNMDASWTEVTREQTQRHVYGGGWWAAGTTNLDYFPNWFQGIDTDSGATFLSNRPVVVPGASREFYLPSDAMVIFCWSVFWVNSSNDADNHSRLYLYVDGAVDEKVMRRVERCSDTLAPSGTSGIVGNPYYHKFMFPARKARWWSGHSSVELSAGWHSAGLRLYCSEDVPQTRIWARSFRVIWLKKATTWG